MKTIVLCTGGYDPIHSGHIVYFQAAKSLGDILVVGVNSDSWLTRKKGLPFMPASERINIVDNLKMVDHCILFDDSDGSAKEAIKNVRKLYPDDRIIFANGGDRTAKNIPEMDIVDDNLEFAFGVGGEDKKNSSSWILQEWKAPKTERPWGYYRILLNNGQEVKLKEITVEPGKALSMQRHQKRAEHWFVSEGTATVYTVNRKTDIELWGVFTKHEHIHINKEQWHQLSNETNDPLNIIEIQYGEECIEEDIERK
jgi:cytidyltransferase-like protein